LLLAANFTREIDRLWKGADLGINAALERKVQENHRHCGSGLQRELMRSDGVFEGFRLGERLWLAQASNSQQLEKHKKRNRPMLIMHNEGRSEVV
jgi:hypothetical protein